MIAVIEVNGKQFVIKEGDKIKIQSPKVGEIKVLLLTNGEETQIGTPYLEGKKVETKIVKQGRERKKIIFHYHSKTRHRKKAGHRQHYTDLEIVSVK
jgi:large subunit ribosomal protein L21